MKKTFKYILTFFAVSVFVSCNNSSNKNEIDKNIYSFKELEKAKWLIGEWQNNSHDGNLTEVWERKNDSTFFGKSSFVVGIDTASSETINIEQSDNQLFYIPTVKGQNAGKSVKFTLTSSTGSQLIFENKNHDFPQKISYTLISNDSLLAEISGLMEGKFNAIKFPMKRIK